MFDIFNSILDIIIIIFNGIGTFVDFVLSVPGLFHNLLSVIPEPFYTILASFIGFIILIVLMKFVSTIVSGSKGGS